MLRKNVWVSDDIIKTNDVERLPIKSEDAAIGYLAKVLVEAYIKHKTHGNKEYNKEECSTLLPRIHKGTGGRR